MFYENRALTANNKCIYKKYSTNLYNLLRFSSYTKNIPKNLCNLNNISEAFLNYLSFNSSFKYSGGGLLGLGLSSSAYGKILVSWLWGVEFDTVISSYSILFIYYLSKIKFILLLSSYTLYSYICGSFVWSILTRD